MRPTTGRRPATEDLNLQAIGVATGPRGEVKVDEYLRTAHLRVWAAGDVTGDAVMSGRFFDFYTYEFDTDGDGENNFYAVNGPAFYYARYPTTKHSRRLHFSRKLL